MYVLSTRERYISVILRRLKQLKVQGFRFDQKLIARYLHSYAIGEQKYFFLAGIVVLLAVFYFQGYFVL